MKRFIFAFSVIFALLVNGENLLPNPQFAPQPGRAYPKSWYASPNAVAQAVKLADGKMALELNTSTNGKRSHWQCSLGKIAAGENYRLTATVIGTAGVKGRIYTESSKPRWQTYGSTVFTCTGKPQQVSFEFAFKPFSQTPYLVFRLDTPGNIRFYDIKVEKYAANLVRNPEFIKLSRWSKGNNAVLTPVVDKEKGKALRITSGGKNPSMAIQRGLPVTAGRNYTFTVEFKGTPGVKASAYIECSGPWKTFGSKRITCNGKWQKITVDFNFAQMKKSAYLVLRIHDSKGEVIFANPRIVPAQQTTVSNGAFEAGAAGWELNHGRVVNSGGAQKNVLELKNYSGPAQAVQKNIFVKGGQMYRLSYLVRGGTDNRYTDSQNATWFRVAPRLNGKFLKNTEHFQDSFFAWFRKSVVFTPEKDCKIDIVCQLKDPGLVQFDDITLTPVKSKLPPVEIVLDFPYAFRETALIGAAGDISGKVIANIPGISRFEIAFNGKRNTSAAGKFSFALPQKAGIYPVSVKAFDSKGKVLAATETKFTVRAPRKREITFREDRIMLVDGVPFFPIGVWSIRGNKSNNEKMKIVAESGFNCARARGDQIDDAAEYGLLTLVNVIEGLPKFANAQHKAIWMKNYFAGLQTIQNHPSLIGYCNSDEPAWRGVNPEPMIAAYKLLRKFDPSRPILLNEAPRGHVDDLRIFTRACDLYGVDIYPVPYPNNHSGLPDKMMTSVGKYTDICREVTRDTKPTWMTLQAFSWNVLNKRPNGVYPTPFESRFMAYNAIAHGATGLLYWGFNAGADNWDYFKTLSITIKELRRMTGVFAGKTITPAGMRCNAPEINIMHKQVNGRNYYIVLNEGEKKLTVKFNVSGSKLFVLTENRSVTIANGTFTDTFKPWDVHVYSETPEAPAPLPEIPTRRMTKRVSYNEDFRQAKWIWYPGKNKINGHRAIFTREITLDTLPEKAEFAITADDYFKLWINGEPVMEHNRNGRTHNTVSVKDVRSYLKKGKNTILIKACDGNNAPCGLLYSLRLESSGKPVKVIISDRSTFVQEPGKNPKVPAQELGKFGCSPWGWQATPQPALTNCGELPFLF